MEYLVKITQEYELESLWKYEFLDIETNQQDYFYYDKQINYAQTSIKISFFRYF